MNAHESFAGRCAAVYQLGKPAGQLQELPEGCWRFVYNPDYRGLPISLTMPVRHEPYDFKNFPAVFDGLLPEGLQLEALLRKHKIDRNDLFKQLVTVGEDMVGSLVVRPIEESQILRRDPSNA